ncbi:MAG: hypothetical protein K2O20_07670, partial [Duncaniella sp.]|nr:hypothetical protein [Duncaniella sp.]
MGARLPWGFEDIASTRHNRHVTSGIQRLCRRPCQPRHIRNPAPLPETMPAAPHPESSAPAGDHANRAASGIQRPCRRPCQQRRIRNPIQLRHSAAAFRPGSTSFAGHHVALSVDADVRQDVDLLIARDTAAHSAQVSRAMSKSTSC